MVDDADYRVLEERVSNFIQESESDRRYMREAIADIRKQTHEWMQDITEELRSISAQMLNRLPPWAVAIGSLLTTAIGALTALLFTQK